MNKVIVATGNQFAGNLSLVEGILLDTTASSVPGVTYYNIAVPNGIARCEEVKGFGHYRANAVIGLEHLAIATNWGISLGREELAEAIGKTRYLHRNITYTEYQDATEQLIAFASMPQVQFTIEGETDTELWGIAIDSTKSPSEFLVYSVGYVHECALQDSKLVSKRLWSINAMDAPFDYRYPLNTLNGAHIGDLDKHCGLLEDSKLQYAVAIVDEDKVIDFERKELDLNFGNI